MFSSDKGDLPVTLPSERTAEVRDLSSPSCSMSKNFTG